MRYCGHQPKVLYQSYDVEKLMFQLTPLGPHAFGTSSPRIRFRDFYGFSLLLYDKNALRFIVKQFNEVTHQGPSSTKVSHIMEALNAMKTMDSYEGRNDLGGYRSPPTYSTGSQHNFLF